MSGETIFKYENDSGGVYMSLSVEHADGIDNAFEVLFDKLQTERRRLIDVE